MLESGGGCAALGRWESREDGTVWMGRRACAVYAYIVVAPCVLWKCLQYCSVGLVGRAVQHRDMPARPVSQTRSCTQRGLRRKMALCCIRRTKCSCRVADGELGAE